MKFHLDLHQKKKAELLFKYNFFAKPKPNGKMKGRTVLCLVTIAAAAAILTTTKVLSRQLIATYPTQTGIRSTLSNDNSSNHSECRNRTIDEFPKDFLTLEQKRHGGVIIHILITAYLFCAIAIVCDEYFVHSLNRISKGWRMKKGDQSLLKGNSRPQDLKLKEDVAGATFMAAGSSAPELFTSLVGVLIAKSDVGTGTIVGSAVFNVLFIIAVCALAAKMVLQIDWYPLSRDSLYYIVAVGALLGVLSDGYVKWYEAAILIGLYFVYIIEMYFNEQLQAFFKSKSNSAQLSCFETISSSPRLSKSSSVTSPTLVSE